MIPVIALKDCSEVQGRRRRIIQDHLEKLANGRDATVAPEPLTKSGVDCRKVRDGEAVVPFRWTPHPAIVTLRDNKGFMRLLLYLKYTTFTGWRVLLTYIARLRFGRPFLFPISGNLRIAGWRGCKQHHSSTHLGLEMVVCIIRMTPL